MDLNERETLVKVEQQLKDSIKNQEQIIDDLREIFGKIDANSKATLQIETDLRVHLETSKVTRAEAEEKVNQLEKKNDNVEVKLDKITKKVEEYQTTLNVLKAIIWTCGILFGILSTVFVIIKFFKA
jgi:hypothetical protein